MDMLPVQNMQKSKTFVSSALIFSEVHRCLPLIGIIQKLQKRRFYLFFFLTHQNSVIFLFLTLPLSLTALGRSLRGRLAAGQAGHLQLSQLILESKSKPGSCVKAQRALVVISVLAMKKGHYWQLACQGVIYIFQGWTDRPKPSRAGTYLSIKCLGGQMSQRLILVMKRVARFLGNDLNIYLKTVLEIGLQRSDGWRSCIAHSNSVICSMGSEISVATSLFASSQTLGMRY